MYVGPSAASSFVNRAGALVPRKHARRADEDRAVPEVRLAARTALRRVALALDGDVAAGALGIMDHDAFDFNTCVA